MFERARNIFKNIKKSMGSKEYKENISEFQKASEKLVYEYDTADWENRALGRFAFNPFGAECDGM